MISQPVRFQLPPKLGIVTLVWERNRFKVVKEGKETVVVNESQGKILKELGESTEGMIATEIGQRLGMTHAGALFLIKPLIKAGLVERVPLRGGGVLYYTPVEIVEKLSPELEGVKVEIEKKAGKKIQDLGVKELYGLTKELPTDVKRALLNWVIEGGWIQ